MARPLAAGSGGDLDAPVTRSAAIAAAALAVLDRLGGRCSVLRSEGGGGNLDAERSLVAGLAGDGGARG